MTSRYVLENPYPETFVYQTRPDTGAPVVENTPTEKGADF